MAVAYQRYGYVGCRKQEARNIFYAMCTYVHIRCMYVGIYENMNMKTHERHTETQR